MSLTSYRAIDFLTLICSCDKNLGHSVGVSDRLLCECCGELRRDTHRGSYTLILFSILKCSSLAWRGVQQFASPADLGMAIDRALVCGTLASSGKQQPLPSLVECFAMQVVLKSASS